MTFQKADIECVVKVLPGTRLDIQRKLNMSPGFVSRTVRELKRLNRVHIGDWTTPINGGVPVANWVAGPGEDAPKPPPIPAAERVRRCRAKNAAEHKAAVARIHPLQAAFFGISG